MLIVQKWHQNSYVLRKSYAYWNAIKENSAVIFNAKVWIQINWFRRDNKKIIKYYFNNSNNHKYSSLNFLSNTLNKHFKKKKYY